MLIRALLAIAVSAPALSGTSVESKPQAGAVEVATARAESIGFRLAVQGAPLCPDRTPLSGAALQILDQFTPRDRPAMIATYHLDRGPRVVAVAAASPASASGLMPDDIILAINDQQLAATIGSTAPFDQASAQAALDTIDARIEGPVPARLSVLRGGIEHRLSLMPVSACPMGLHVARSSQRNAFADGSHIFLPTGLIDWIQDDDQLALVIAHEMAHNILGHAASMRRVKGAADRRALRRQQEDAADILGAKLVRAAGYDLLAASKVFLLSSGGIELFASHRDATGRIKLILTQAQSRDEGRDQP